MSERKGKRKKERKEETFLDNLVKLSLIPKRDVKAVHFLRLNFKQVLARDIMSQQQRNGFVPDKSINFVEILAENIRGAL